MLPSIPLSQIVKINPGILNAAGDGVDLNLLLLTQSTYAPIGQVIEFASATDVATYFGALSTEAALSAIYFNGYTNCTKTPGKLLVAQYNTAAQSAWLMGASLQAVSLATLKTYTGTLTVTVDGTAKTSSSINLTAATSFSNAATIIQAAFTSPNFTVSYDATRYAFKITSSTTGVSSTITVGTGTIADSLGLSSNAGAILSQGAVAQASGSAFMANVTANLTINWATFTTTFEPDSTTEESFALWASQQQYRFAYIGWDTDAQAKVAGSTTTFGAYLVANAVDSVIPLYSPDASHAVFIGGFVASLDFERKNGRATLAFKYQGGLTPSVTNATDASNLIANGYNFLGRYANAKEYFNFAYPGQISGKWDWIDTFVNQIWLNANLQSSVINLLMNVGSIPYNKDGYALQEAAMLDPVIRAVNFGAIRAGVALSESQKAQIRNALGYDASSAIYAKGYVIDIKDPSSAVRAARGSPSTTMYYADGGSIQAITVASIAIQ